MFTVLLSPQRGSITASSYYGESLVLPQSSNTRYAQKRLFLSHSTSRGLWRQPGSFLHAPKRLALTLSLVLSSHHVLAHVHDQTGVVYVGR